MKRIEHLLTILAEECMEVAQRATKALRFGIEEVEPGQTKTNAQRMMDEIEDLLGAYLLLTGGRLPDGTVVGEPPLSTDNVRDVVASSPPYGIELLKGSEGWPAEEPMVFDQGVRSPLECEPSLREAQEAIDTEVPSHAQPDYSDPAFDEPVPLTEDEALEAMADDTCRNQSDH